MNASIPADDLREHHDGSPIAQLLRAPFQARSYTNLLYLLLSFPLGISHFTFLTTGLALGLGLMITVLGLPIIVLTLWGSWWFAAMERQLAIGLLGAEVPPMGPTPFHSGQGFRRDLEQFLSNRVTWTGHLFLWLKFPLGLVSFAMVIILIAVSFSFLLVPFLYPLSFIEWDNVLIWWVDSPAEAGLCFLAGLLFTYVSLLLLNGLAALWKVLAVATLGSERFREPVQPAPVEAMEAPTESPAVPG
ncbi:MAG TPA: sensor domain-containing protein [Thermoanaerobaculia bacterium]|nr:sensor domain-containing protein [Thermoanaerobaculia bacterium]